MASNRALLIFFHYQTRLKKFQSEFFPRVSQLADHIDGLAKLYQYSLQHLDLYLNQLEDKSLAFSYMDDENDAGIEAALMSKDWTGASELMRERIRVFLRFRELFHCRYDWAAGDLLTYKKILADEWVDDASFSPPRLYSWSVWKHTDTLLAAIKYLSKCFDIFLENNAMFMMDVYRGMDIGMEGNIEFCRKRKIMDDLGHRKYE